MTAKYGKRLANSQSSRYWKIAKRPDGSTCGCNTAPGRRDTRDKHTRISPEMTLIKGTVHRLLWPERLYAFRYTTVQVLKPNNCQKHVVFCEWLLQQQNTNNGFIAYILWTDKACFTRDVLSNHYNSNMRSHVNTHAIRPQNHHAPGYRLPRPLDQSLRSCSMAALFSRSYTVWFFPMGPSQETGVSRRSDNTNNLVARLHTACTSVDPATLQRGMKAIPRRAQACLDMHNGNFEHLP
ncbi:uncharacterized protein TNCV_4389511 [Trichonephila clavipes]|nr:uncharacterized protein TNCV_4389511 [Trichonephila clavipes]